MTLQRRFVLCVIVLCCAVALSAQAQEWKSHSYPSDGFSASFPDVPTQEKQDVTIEGGSVEMRVYSAGVSSPVAMVFVGVVDYGAAAANMDTATLLENSKQSAMANTKSHLLREKKFTLDGYHGLEFECENDTNHFFDRTYIVGSTLYQTLVAHAIADKYADTARFLDSFKLIKRVRN